MKATAQELKIRQRMQPGVITLGGFLGADTRPLNEIIEDDANALARTGYTARELAERMDYFTKASWDSFQDFALIDGIWQAETEIHRGFLPCPWGHKGIHRKAITNLTNTREGISVCWSSLNIHLIREHGFFEGRGSTFRLEPEVLAKALF